MYTRWESTKCITENPFICPVPFFCLFLSLHNKFPLKVLQPLMATAGGMWALLTPCYIKNCTDMYSVMISFCSDINNTNMCHSLGKPTMWILTMSDTSQTAQLLEMARSLKTWIKEVEGLYYTWSENKDADQLRGNREADQHLCFRYLIAQYLYFLNTKFQASCHLQCLYSLVCVRPGQNPHCWFSHDAAHF